MTHSSFTPGSGAARIEALAGAEDLERPAVQSVLAVIEDALRENLMRERSVQYAAISLAHSELLAGLIEELGGARQAVSTLKSGESVPASDPEVSVAANWWFALSEATQGLEVSIGRLSALVGVQPRGSTARDLVGIVLRLFREHHRLLLDEASQWIEG